MFMRLVRFRLPEGKLWEVRRVYDAKVIPALQGTEGCRYASLLQTARGLDAECVSLTLWDTPEHAAAYEASGLYDRLLDAIDDAVGSATEWRAELASPHAVGPSPVQDPEVEAFAMLRGADTSAFENAPARLFLRIVAVTVEPDRVDEFKQRYEEVVAPALLETPGCRAAFVVEGVEEASRALSITLWDSEEDAIRYEMSGKFDDLTATLREFFSGLYMWKLSLVAPHDRTEVSGDDLDVGGYHLVTGRKLSGS